MTIRFPGRLALQQRVLPSYRAPFFELLAQSCEGGLSLFAGLPRPGESIVSAEKLQVANFTPGNNLHLLGGSFYLCYQVGLVPWLADWNPDALIVEANPRYLATPSAVKWMHSRGRKVIGWGLGAPPLSGPQARVRQSRRIHFLLQFISELMPRRLWSESAVLNTLGDKAGSAARHNRNNSRRRLFRRHHVPFTRRQEQVRF